MHTALATSGRFLRQAILTLRDSARRARSILRESERHDLTVVHRELLPLGPPILEGMLVRAGCPLVYDFDDAIYIPDTFRGKSWIKPLKCAWKVGTIARWSRRVIVGNRHLQKFAESKGAVPRLIPTTIDLETYQLPPERPFSGKPVIGWSGSWSTQRHLETVLPALRELAREQKFKLLVLGARELDLTGLDAEVRSWNASREVQDLSQIDIGIMPLPDDPWAKGKCGLKLLQYMALGIPSVASPVGVNSEILRHGTNGFLAATRQDWVRCLRQLLASEDLRHRFRREGRKTVEDFFSAKRGAEMFQSVLEEVILESAQKN